MGILLEAVVLALCSISCFPCVSITDSPTVNTTQATTPSASTTVEVPTESACGKPEPNINFTRCHGEPHIYPDCKSFPGRVLNLYAWVKYYNHKHGVVATVTWSVPTTGFRDLWGYEVDLTSIRGNVGHTDCYRIHKAYITTLFFDHLSYDTKYKVLVQSLPGKKDGSPDSNKEDFTFSVGKQCEFIEFMKEKLCCSITNASATYFNGTIQVNWNWTCLASSTTLDRYLVAWFPKPHVPNCSHKQEYVKGRQNYTIEIPERCRRTNYSVWVYGTYGTDDDGNPKLTSHYAVVMVTIPIERNKTSQIIIKEINVKDVKGIVAAIIGSVVGVTFASFFLFFIYRRYFAPIYIQLPSGPPGCSNPGITTSQEANLEQETEPLRRVFLMHTHCCDKCNWVVHCLGMMLKATGMVEARADVWSEQEIKSGVMNWYEAEIREASCVVVIASAKMTSRDVNVHMDDEGDDPLRIAMQLNLIRGEIAHDPDSGKFLPVFFTYNGDVKDIPNFLGSKMTYSLPRDLMRMVYNVLNIEKIQPHRFQPVTVLGADKGHPFHEAKMNLIKAIGDATLGHNCTMNNCVELIAMRDGTD